MVGKKEKERDTADKTFERMLNRFCSRMKLDRAMMRFEKKRKRYDESIDRFLDDLENLKKGKVPEESTKRIILSVASKFENGMKSDDLRICWQPFIRCTIP